MLIPFGLWNKFNHSEFKITPIEGGAGVAHLGYWQLKLPDGYTEPFYWHNNTSFDLTKPKLYSPSEVKQNVILYEQEWDKVLHEISIYNTTEDLENLAIMKKNNPGIFLLYNSQYTKERENQLWALTFKNIKENPSYYVKSRIYHFIRFYITGINFNSLNNANSFFEKLRVVYPFIITSIYIFIGLLFSTVFILYKSNAKFANYLPLISLCWYLGLVHIPFAIQARYTVPVHCIILIIVSVSVIKLSKLNYE